MDRLGCRASRRRWIGGALALAALPFARAAPPAAAGKGWCRTDPVVEIDGHLADIFLVAPPDAPLKVTGPNRIVVAVPRGVEAKLILAGPGFGKGEKVRFVHSRRLAATGRGVEVQVTAFVPATDDEMPVRLEFAPDVVGVLAPARAKGRANRPIRLTTDL